MVALAFEVIAKGEQEVFLVLNHEDGRRNAEGGCSH
jgi:hypothetical protein